MTMTIRLEKSGRSMGYLRVLGSLCILCALGTLVKTGIDIDQEKKHARWPSAVATITQRSVREFMNGRDHAWRIDCQVRYTAGGKELTSDIHSGIGGFLDERAMRQWASQHPAGTPLPIRYDPGHYNIVVPDIGAMPETGTQVRSDVKAVLFFCIVSIILLTISRRTGADRPVNGASDCECMVGK
jgi:hypothetical protein